MALIPKISSLLRLPGLLQQKQEAEERSKKENEEEAKKHPFEIDDEITIDPEKLSGYIVEQHAQIIRQPKSGNKNVGQNIDVKI